MPVPGERIAAESLPSLRVEPCGYPHGFAAAGGEPAGAAWAGGPGYLYADGEAILLASAADAALLLRQGGGRGLEARIPVLAVGSNAYPRQLLDKFREDPVGDDRVLTVQCRVTDVGVSYVGALSGASSSAL